MAQAFGTTDPRPAGFDGAIEFPPHKLARDLPSILRNARVISGRLSLGSVTAGRLGCVSISW